MIGAVVLAGRPNTGALAGLGPEASEALIEIAGRPMLAHILEALAACAELDPICVVGPVTALSPWVDGRRVIAVPAGATLTENVRRGVAALAGRRWALILTSDIPLVRPQTIEEFLAHCDRQGARFFYPIVPRACYEQRFPGSRRTYARLADGVFTGGNAFFVDTEIVNGALELLDRFYAMRKSPLRLAQFLGPSFVVRLLLGRLRLVELEQRISQWVGAPGKAVICEHAEIGFDVDRPEDVAIAEGYLRTENAHEPLTT
ncbi:MAG TPA: nucleotidyltransferase family protein [Bacillota bacterium]